MCSGSAIIIASGIVATVVGGVGVYQGVQQKKAAEEANNTNVQMTEDTNAANVEAVKDTNQTNIQLQREMNEYNSPQNQRKMYEEAGFNPYMAADKSSFSSVQSSIPTQQAPQLQAPHVQPEALGDIASPIQQAALSVLQAYIGVAEADLNKANTVSVNLNNDFQSEMNPKLLDQQDKINHSLGLKNYAQDFENKFADLTFDLRVKELRQNVVGKALENGIAVYENLLAAKNLDAFDERLKAELAAFAADIVYKGALSKKTFEEVNLVVQQVAETKARAAGIDLDNKQKEAVGAALVAAVTTEADYRVAAAKLGKDKIFLEDKFFDIETLKKSIELDDLQVRRRLQKEGLGASVQDYLYRQTLNKDGFEGWSAGALLGVYRALEFFGSSITGAAFNLVTPKGSGSSYKTHSIDPSSR